MKSKVHFFGYIYAGYAFLMFIVFMFISLPFILISSAFGIKGGNFIYKICRLWGILWYFTIGIRHKDIYESPHDFSRQYIFVANHCSYMDIPATILTMQQPVRILGKYEMVKAPVFGLIYRSAVILVDRRDAERRAKSFRALKAAVKHGISIFIFPEGTFNETTQPLKDFYDGAFRIAIETQTPIKPLLYIDTLKRMHYHSVFSMNPGNNYVVYLAEVPVEHYTIQQLPELKEHVYSLMEEGLRRYLPYPR